MASPIQTSHLQPGQQPSAALIFETMNAYHKTAALRGAIELDLFTAIAEGANTPQAIAQKCSASERGVRILCDFLTISGLLSKHDGRYENTPDTAAFLDRRSPMYIGSAVRFLNSPHLTECFNDVAEVVRRGTTLRPNGTLSPNDQIWTEFARSMAPMMAPAAELIVKLIEPQNRGRLKVLDIACGHGAFGIAIAKQNPQASVVAVDWPNVLEVALENARQAGVQDRYRTIPGSAFEVDYGADYDIALITNFLHHFDIPTCEQLLRKVVGCLKPGGKACTVEMVPDEDRVSPPAPAAFSFIMLSTTPAGDAYTASQYQRMFRNAGFRETEIVPVQVTPQSVLVSSK